VAAEAAAGECAAPPGRRGGAAGGGPGPLQAAAGAQPAGRLPHRQPGARRQAPLIVPERRQSVAPDQRPAMAVKLQPCCFAHATSGTLLPVTSALWLPVTQMSAIFWMSLGCRAWQHCLVITCSCSHVPCHVFHIFQACQGREGNSSSATFNISSSRARGLLAESGLTAGVLTPACAQHRWTPTASSSIALRRSRSSGCTW